MWTRTEDKLLELLLLQHFPRWDVIASALVDRTPEQASQRYERVLGEVTHLLQAPEVDTPREWDTQAERTEAVVATMPTATTAVADVTLPSSSSAVAEKALVPAPSAADGAASEDAAKKTKPRGKRKKPEKWTEEEHNLFLEGLERYGKGKWKRMSIEYLTTKTASQIASHDQKHRNRLAQRKRNGCKRPSIHDITEPTTAAAAILAAGGGEPPAAKGDGLVGAVEEVPAEDEDDIEREILQLLGTPST